ncbi:hypothetical protein E2C01_055765 [Portunus trituberculatus]|uniref:Uncharacterized protein n=1 Tax=Portunus trituberculatus TaxID=210409 RepID=A0A5B7GND6_PORTR|nr:hypothetical protein [Portunus trituberculatus]
MLRAPQRHRILLAANAQRHFLSDTSELIHNRGAEFPITDSVFFLDIICRCRHDRCYCNFCDATAKTVTIAPIHINYTHCHNQCNVYNNTHHQYCLRTTPDVIITTTTNTTNITNNTTTITVITVTTYISTTCTNNTIPTATTTAANNNTNNNNNYSNKHF